MGKLVIECFDKKLKLKKLAKAVYKVMVQKENLKAELIFADADKIRSLNADTRGIDKVTDVLSYPTMGGLRGIVLDKADCRTELDGKYILLGSIVLCEEKIREQALEYGHSQERERDYLIIHGLLHLFGYDHIKDADKTQMRDKEKEILAILGIGDSEDCKKRTEDCNKKTKKCKKIKAAKEKK